MSDHHMHAFESESSAGPPGTIVGCVGAPACQQQWMMTRPGHWEPIGDGATETDLQRMQMDARRARAAVHLQRAIEFERCAVEHLLHAGLLDEAKLAMDAANNSQAALRSFAPQLVTESYERPPDGR